MEGLIILAEERENIYAEESARVEYSGQRCQLGEEAILCAVAHIARRDDRPEVAGFAGLPDRDSRLVSFH